MKQNTLRLFLILFLLSLLITFFDRRGVFDFAKAPIQIVTNPIFTNLNSYKDSLNFLTFWKSGEMRIKNLEERNLELMAFKDEADRLREENVNLRSQFETSVVKPHQLIVAQVLGVNRYIEIDKGKVGQVVVYKDNLVGRIIRATPRVSYVQKPSDPNEKVPVRIGQSTGIALGQFNSSIILDKVAANEAINEGDIVTTSGEGETFMPNLIVGKISKVLPSEGEIFKKAEIAPLISENDLRMVFVIDD